MNTEHWNPFSGISNVLSDLKSGNIGSIYGDLMETAEQKRKKKRDAPEKGRRRSAVSESAGQRSAIRRPVVRVRGRERLLAAAGVRARGLALSLPSPPISRGRRAAPRARRRAPPLLLLLPLHSRCVGAARACAERYRLLEMPSA